MKGILRADDARRAWPRASTRSSSRTTAATTSTAACRRSARCPEIVAAVGDEIEILFDSGVRRGIDVIRALALGARAVMLGRAYVWAHLAAGEPGVRHMLELFRQQVDDGLAYLGVRRSTSSSPPSSTSAGRGIRRACRSDSRPLRESGQHRREPLELRERIGPERLHGHVDRARSRDGRERGPPRPPRLPTRRARRRDGRCRRPPGRRRRSRAAASSSCSSRSGR